MNDDKKKFFTSEDLFGDIIGELEHDDDDVQPKEKPELPSIPKPEPIQQAPKPAPIRQAPPAPKPEPIKQAPSAPEPVAQYINPPDDSGIINTINFDLDMAETIIEEAPKEHPFGNYFLLDKIATGGMAELFKAKRSGVEGFQKIVAIKRILPHLSDNDEFVTMFIDEAKLAAQLNHPNIVQIFDLGKEEGTYFIAMELVTGHDLRVIIKRMKELGVVIPEEVAAHIGTRILSALEYAHKKKGFDGKNLSIVHRDISPQNILVSEAGEVRLVDFGIAKAATKASHTMAGSLKGKLLYMSPEQAWGKTVDHRSDVFSLGICLYEAITGQRCFGGDNELSVLEKVRNGHVVSPKEYVPTLSDEMEDILLTALQTEADDRYDSAKDMEKALRQLLERRKKFLDDADFAESIHSLFKISSAAEYKVIIERIIGRHPDIPHSEQIPESKSNSTESDSEVRHRLRDSGFDIPQTEIYEKSKLEAFGIAAEPELDLLKAPEELPRSVAKKKHKKVGESHLPIKPLLIIIGSLLALIILVWGIKKLTAPTLPAQTVLQPKAINNSKQNNVQDNKPADSTNKKNETSQ